jgi:hypothetical protein
MALGAATVHENSIFVLNNQYDGLPEKARNLVCYTCRAKEVRFSIRRFCVPVMDQEILDGGKIRFVTNGLPHDDAPDFSRGPGAQPTLL